MRFSSAGALTVLILIAQLLTGCISPEGSAGPEARPGDPYKDWSWFPAPIDGYNPGTIVAFNKHTLREVGTLTELQPGKPQVVVLGSTAETSNSSANALFTLLKGLFNLGADANATTKVEYSWNLLGKSEQIDLNGNLQLADQDIEAITRDGKSQTIRAAQQYAVIAHVLRAEGLSYRFTEESGKSLGIDAKYKEYGLDTRGDKATIASYVLEENFGQTLNVRYLAFPIYDANSNLSGGERDYKVGTEPIHIDVQELE